MSTLRTVTLNTGFDLLVSASDVRFGGVAEVVRQWTLASGKGINAARAVVALGGEVEAYGLVGRGDEERFSSLLAADGVRSHLVAVDGPTRCNLTLLLEDGSRSSAHFRASGFCLADDRPIEALLRRLCDDLRPGDVVSLHGSTPSGLAASTWARVARAVSDAGARVLVDVHGAPLVELLDALPVLLTKPNEQEIAVFSEPDASAALRHMAASGVWLPTVSLGARGLCFHEAGRLYLASCEVERPRVEVGAGDVCVAGMAVAVMRGADAQATARAGVAAAAAHVSGARDLGAVATELAHRVQTTAVAG